MLPLLAALTPVLDKVLSFIPNPAEREKAKIAAEADLRNQETEIMKILAAEDKMQADVNLEEAKNTNLFVSGWRPFVGWTCGAGFAWATVIQPILLFTAAMFHHTVIAPAIQTEILIQALFGMLGMGGMRMMEKKWGVASK